MRKSGLIELEAVAAVARRGSFRAAAAELGMSSSALSHAVAALEAKMGVRLFNRTTRSVSLTEAGEQFVANIGPALAQINGAMEAVNSHRDTPAGTLRINTFGGAAQRVLKPIVFEYLRLYPDMRVELVTEGKLVDIVVDGFDAGIRTADMVPRDMIAVPLSPEIQFLVAGSPAYFERHPPPQTPGDLMSHQCVRMRLRSGAIYRWEFERRDEVMTLDVPGPIILDDAHLITEAALEGVGLAYLAQWPVQDHLDAGRLVPVLEGWVPSSPGLCLYYPGHRHVPAGLRAFIDLIRRVTRASDLNAASDGQAFR